MFKLQLSVAIGDHDRTRALLDGSIKHALTARHPWLPGAVVKAFMQAGTAALDRLVDTSATKVTLPFIAEQLRVGADDRAYGVQASRRPLEGFVRHHHAQRRWARPVAVDEIFHRATCETYSI